VGGSPDESGHYERDVPMAKRSIVGELINFRGLVYGPVNEMGVVALFAKVCEELGFIIEEIRAEFPDCIARRQVDKGWERVAIEFEFVSSNFQRHGHDPEACDLIVCYEHDWETCPVPVLALKPYIAEAKANVSGPLQPSRVRACTHAKNSRGSNGRMWADEGARACKHAPYPPRPSRRAG